MFRLQSLFVPPRAHGDPDSNECMCCDLETPKPLCRELCVALCLLFEVITPLTAQHLSTACPQVDMRPFMQPFASQSASQKKSALSLWNHLKRLLCGGCGPDLCSMFWLLWREYYSVTRAETFDLLDVDKKSYLVRDLLRGKLWRFIRTSGFLYGCINVSSF